MSETVNTIERQFVFLTKLLQPAIRSLIVHRFAVPFHEKPVSVFKASFSFFKERLSALSCIFSASAFLAPA